MRMKDILQGESIQYFETDQVLPQQPIPSVLRYENCASPSDDMEQDYEPIQTHK